MPRRAIAIGLVIGVHYALKDKLGAAGKFMVIDRLLMQMKEEGFVFKGFVSPKMENGAYRGDPRKIMKLRLKHVHYHVKNGCPKSTWWSTMG